MKRFLSLLTLIVSVLAGYHVLSIWKGVNLYQKDVTKERLLRSARLTSFNPDPYYRLGILYQWDIRNVDLNESLNYLKGAIERNPLEQEYWLNVARAFQRTERNRPFERALENAIQVNPTSFQGRWVTGNLLLQQGDLEKALIHFAYILRNYPEQSNVVYNVWMNVVKSPDFILGRLIPKDPSSLSQYLSYLYGLGDMVTARKVWGMKTSLDHKIDRNETLRHIDFLISHNEFQEAFQIWKARLREEKQPISYDGNVVTNGGFEKEEILGGGFDWKMQSVSGAQISSDHGVYYEGKSSLKIHFNGKENVDFQHVYQFVALKPNTDYLLRAHMKTNGVTTKSGVKIEVVGMGSAFHAASESLTGDNAWKELTVSFHTPSQSQGGLVRVRREPTDKFDRFISGIVWIDDFRLTERKNTQ